MSNVFKNSLKEFIMFVRNRKKSKQHLYREIIKVNNTILFYLINEMLFIKFDVTLN